MYDSNSAALYNLDRTGGGANIAIGSIYAKTNVAADSSPLGTFKFYRRKNVGPTTITSGKITATTFSAGGKRITISSTKKRTSSRCI